MVRDGSVVRELLSDEGFIPSLGGRTVIQMSTIAAAESLRLMEDVRGAAGDYLEAPVLGSVPQAEEGKLLVMVGGSSEQLERWGGLLRCFGPEPRLVGPVGHAATLKLAMNQLIASLSAAFSLSLGMVRRKGIEVDLFMDILRKSAFYAPTFDRKLPQMLARDFSSANFPGRSPAQGPRPRARRGGRARPRHRRARRRAPRRQGDRRGRQGAGRLRRALRDDRSGVVEGQDGHGQARPAAMSAMLVRVRP